MAVSSGPDILKKFKRVMSRITGNKGNVRESVKDVPSSFLVEVAKTKQQDKEKFDSLVKSSGEDPDDAEAAASELQLYVSDLQTKGRNRNQIQQKSSAARKAATPAKGRKITR